MKQKQAEAVITDLAESAKLSASSSSYTTISTAVKTSRTSVSAPVSPDNSARSTNPLRPSGSQPQSHTGLSQNNRERKASDDSAASQRTHGYGTISKKQYDSRGKPNLENSSSVDDISWRTQPSKLTENKEI